jgi:glycosyltransferase involved in cell wall biosynthesis
VWNHSIQIISLPADSEKNPVKKWMKSIKGRWYQRSLFRSAGSYMTECYPVLRDLLGKCSYDCIVFAHLSSLELAPYVRRWAPLTKVILDAHNVDHLLYGQERDLSVPDNKKEYERLKKVESSLHDCIDGFIACSHEDRSVLTEINHGKLNGCVIPNGTDINRNKFSADKDCHRPHLIFCGSLDYEPNLDGLQWFVYDILPALQNEIPDIRLTIIGRNPAPSLSKEMSTIPGVNFIGAVADVRSYYDRNTIAIVPLRKGSGTRLKILEAMALGIPVVSTSKGAEGISVSSGSDIVLADDTASFREAICRLLSDSNYYHQLRFAARQLVVQQYAWSRSGILLKDYISQICS